jgi:sugar lactone lactonase YvrE
MFGIDRVRRDQRGRDGRCGTQGAQGEAMTRATVIREHAPLDEAPIHGVTFDGELVWFARDDELIAFDPQREQVVQRLHVPGACAGTAFDGTHLYQLAGDQIAVVSPRDGRLVRKLEAPHGGACSGMAWADGYLWIGQYRAAKIHKVDAKTGELVKTLSSDRFVTGVSCFDGQLWHASMGDGACVLRRLSTDGTVEQSYEVPVDHIAGIEGSPEGFWCATGKGRLSLIKVG